MKYKFTLDMKTIIMIIICIVIARTLIYYMPETQTYVGKYAYNYVTRNFEQRSLSQLEQSLNKTDEIAFFYLGRGSCGDCRNSIKNIKTINSVTKEDYQLQMNYIELPDLITDTERSVLNKIGIEEIPTMILVNDGEVKQFDINEIGSDDYLNKFHSFIQEERKL